MFEHEYFVIDECLIEVWEESVFLKIFAGHISLLYQPAQQPALAGNPPGGNVNGVCRGLILDPAVNMSRVRRKLTRGQGVISGAVKPGSLSLRK
jgi:hypothetical protein